jgi:hypothetical protein
MVIFRILGVAAPLLGIGWLGFRIPSPRFKASQVSTAEIIPIPTGLPEPVQRFVRAMYGDSLPVVKTALVTGRATVRFNGITMPTRFRFYYDACGAHYHDIQVTWFTLPIMQIHERFLDGRTDKASNQGFWSETLAWQSSLLIRVYAGKLLTQAPPA